MPRTLARVDRDTDHQLEDKHGCNPMWGAVIGDIAGSRFEGSRGGPKDFELFHRRCTFTDDTVCTAAIADIIPNDRKPASTLQA